MTKSIDEVVEYAESLVGLGGTPSHTTPIQWQAARILFPYDPPGAQLNLVQTSSNCLLTCFAVMRFGEVEHPLLHKSHGIYPPGSARASSFREPASMLLEIANDLGALVDVRAMPRNIQRGDMVIIGTGLRTHGFIVRSFNQLDSIIESVDGGQGHLGAAIEYRTRRLGWYDSEKKYYVHEGPNLQDKDRSVEYWIDGERLFGQ